jgi:hypothetical protein
LTVLVEIVRGTFVPLGGAAPVVRFGGAFVFGFDNIAPTFVFGGCTAGGGFVFGFATAATGAGFVFVAGLGAAPDSRTFALGAFFLR